MQLPIRSTIGTILLPKFVIYAGLWLLSFSVWVSAADQQNFARILSFQIAPQALDQALVAFSLQSGLQVIADGQLTNGRISPGVTDQLSPLQALEKLLKGSGLIFQLNSESSVILEKQEENALSDTSILPTITITGKAIQPSYEQSVYNSTHTTTANKRDTPLLETPVNIQVITKPLLDDQQAITIDKSLTTISGLTTGAGSATNSDDIYIRGFRTPAYYRNGFLYDTEFDSWGKRQMANIERIDVVKGSASLLYGRMEPGGMVNIITKRPLDKAYYAFQQQFGSNDFYRTTIDATGPIPDRQDWLYRVNLSYENSSSYRELVENERLFLAPVLQWQISPDTQVTLELEYRHDHLTNDFMEWPYQKGRFIDIPRSRNLMEATPVELDDIFIGLNWSHQINPNWLISHQFATEHREMPKAISMYSKADDLIDGSLLARLMANTQSRNHSYFNTLNLTGQIDLWGLNHQLLFGGEFYRLESKRTFFYHAPAEPIDVYHPQHTGYTLPDHFSQFDVFDSTTHHYGVYFQDQIKLPFGFQVLGGIRYQAVDMEDTVSNYWSFFEDAIASRAGLLWQVQPWLSLYGNYVENLGASNGRDADGKPITPQTAQQLEGGLKTEFMEGRISLTAAYFNIVKQNIATTGLNNVGYSVPVGQQRSQGPELDIKGEILPGWNLTASYANFDANILTDTRGLKGKRPFAIPRNMANIWSTYEFQENELKGFKIGAGINLRDSSTNLPNNYDVPGFITFDLLAAYTHPLSYAKLSLQLNINNLLDKQYFQDVISDINASTSVYIGAPRSLLGAIRVEY